MDSLVTSNSTLNLASIVLSNIINFHLSNKTIGPLVDIKIHPIIDQYILRHLKEFVLMNLSNVRLRDYLKYVLKSIVFLVYLKMYFISFRYYN